MRTSGTPDGPDLTWVPIVVCLFVAYLLWGGGASTMLRRVDAGIRGVVEASGEAVKAAIDLF